jgi:hypothetical protein
MNQVGGAIVQESEISQDAYKGYKFDRDKYVIENILDEERKKYESKFDSDLHRKMYDNIDIRPDSDETGLIIANDYYMKATKAMIKYLESEVSKVKEKANKEGSRIIRTNRGKVVEYKAGSGNEIYNDYM